MRACFQDKCFKSGFVQTINKIARGFLNLTLRCWVMCYVFTIYNAFVSFSLIFRTACVEASIQVQCKNLTRYIHTYKLRFYSQKVQLIQSNFLNATLLQNLISKDLLKKNKLHSNPTRYLTSRNLKKQPSSCHRPISISRQTVSTMVSKLLGHNEGIVLPPQYRRKQQL